MTAILLVKTSSLGDVVHNLPVVSDIQRCMPGTEIDWVVEGAYAAIPRLHRGVRNVLPVSIRRWRARWWQAQTRSEARLAVARLRERRYDAVIDTQGLLKSALIARAARGTRYGLDWASAREPLRWFYDTTLRVPWTRHAVERNRDLAALALGYRKPEPVDYGISVPAAPERAQAPYAVLLHATSARAKLWHEDDWVALSAWLAARGMRVVLPWGNAEERARSERLAARMPNASVPEPWSLEDAARCLAGAALVVGLDTGLTHLAGALGVPTLALYIATDPGATGLHGCARGRNLGAKGAPPSAAEAIRAAAQMCGNT